MVHLPKSNLLFIALRYDRLVGSFYLTVLDKFKLIWEMFRLLVGMILVSYRSGASVQSLTVGDPLIFAVYFTATGRLLHAMKGHSSDVIRLFWLEDPRILVSGSKDGKVKFWTFVAPLMAIDAQANQEPVASKQQEPAQYEFAAETSNYDGTLHDVDI